MSTATSIASSALLAITTLTGAPPADLNLTVGSITFYVAGEKEMIRLEVNGDIYVKGKIITNDMQLVDAMREFLKKAGQ